MKVVVTDWELGSEEPVRRILEPAGLELEFAACRTAGEVAAAGAGAVALMVREAPVDAAAMDRLDGLRLISRLGIGEQRVDLHAALERKIAVADCARFCTDEAVAHSLALVLALNRQLLGARAAAREGLWGLYPPGVGPVLATSVVTLGIVGMGRVGRRLAGAALALGMDVVACDPYVLNAPEEVEIVSLPALLEESDIVVLACPLTAETRHLINAETLARMKPKAYLVNTARGGLVDSEALLAALEAGHLAGAALDTLADEPPPADHPLLARDDVIVTPHVAYYSEQVYHELKVYAAKTVVHYLTGERVTSLLTPDFRRV